MRYILSIVIAISVISCSDETPKQAKYFDLPQLKGRPETTQLIVKTWDRLLQRCPGLKQHQGDLIFSGINDMIDPIMGEMSRAEVVFNVSNTSKSIPTGFLAHGHTCGFGISHDAKSLRIQKVNVCLCA